MKKIILILCIGLLFTCSDSKQGKEWYENRIDVTLIDGNKEMTTFEHEGCQYLVYSGAKGNQGYAFGMHKGNCKNPIHKCN